MYRKRNDSRMRCHSIHSDASDERGRLSATKKHPFATFGGSGEEGRGIIMYNGREMQAADAWKDGQNPDWQTLAMGYGNNADSKNCGVR